MGVAREKLQSISELLSRIELHGETWCYSDLGQRAGFSLKRSGMLHFHVVLHGRVRFACAGLSPLNLENGEAVIVFPGQAHAFRTGADIKAKPHEFLESNRSVDVPPTIAIGSGLPISARVLSGRLEVTWPAKIDGSALPPMLHFRRSESAPIGALLSLEGLPAAGIGPGSAAVLTKFASLLLTLRLRSAPWCRQLISTPIQNPVEKALKVMTSNIHKNWTVDDLAREVGLGRSSFSALFTHQTGLAPMKYLMKLRMEQASVLLLKGKLKIIDIADLVGYGSEAAFSRCFTRYYGITPSQTRNYYGPQSAEQASGSAEISDMGGASANPDIRGRLPWALGSAANNCILGWQTELMSQV